MPGFIAALGMQAAQQAVGSGMGLLLQGGQDRRQLKQESKLQELNIAGQKEMAEFNLQQQMKLWEQTNYRAQMEQLQKAGLNPGLIYGMSGGGGATTATQPSHVPQGAGPKGGGEAVAGMGIQAGLAAAQMELIKAQADNVKADTAKKQGVDTQEAQTRIASLTQGITNAKAQEKMLQVENALKNMELAETKYSQADRMDYIYYQTKQAMIALEMAERESFIQKATLNQKIDIIRAEAIGAAIKNALAENQITLNKAQIQKWTAEISQGLTNLDRQERELTVKRFEAEIRAAFPGISQSLGRILTGFLDEISQLTTGKDPRVRQEYRIDTETKK